MVLVYHIWSEPVHVFLSIPSQREAAVAGLKTRTGYGPG